MKNSGEPNYRQKIIVKYGHIFHVRFTHQKRVEGNKVLVSIQILTLPVLSIPFNLQNILMGLLLIFLFSKLSYSKIGFWGQCV